MNAERLLAYYEKIGEAPDAIAKLRRFILELAVRGKLVPQQHEDEPASELLKRIDAKTTVSTASKRNRSAPSQQPLQIRLFPTDGVQFHLRVSYASSMDAHTNSKSCSVPARPYCG